MKVKVKVAQSCPTRCNPIDYTVHGILQARTLEWVVIPFSRGSSQPTGQTQVSFIAGGFFTILATREAQEYWSGLLFPSSGDFPNPGIGPRSPALQADSLPAEPQGKSKNAGMGSLSLLQRIFPTQESNQGLLHCRQILYQLSHQGSPPTLLPHKPKGSSQGAIQVLKHWRPSPHVPRYCV